MSDEIESLHRAVKEITGERPFYVFRIVVDDPTADSVRYSHTVDPSFVGVVDVVDFIEYRYRNTRGEVHTRRVAVGAGSEGILTAMRTVVRYARLDHTFTQRIGE